MMAAKAIVKGPVQGTVSFYQPHSKSPVFITGKLIGLKAGKHNLFITEYGDSEQSCTNVGPIWDMHYTVNIYLLSLSDFSYKCYTIFVLFKFCCIEYELWLAV